MRWVLGIDGGGTKTNAVLMDETGAVVARGRAGASNAVNVGVEGSAAAIAAAGREALNAAVKTPADVAQILAGISGGGELRRAIEIQLKPSFPNAEINVTSDLMLILAGAGEVPGIAVIAGTGSSVLGKTASKSARAGGFGPIIGDPGSANDIGRKTTALCFQKVLNGEEFLLAEEICKTFEKKWDAVVSLVREQPTVIFPKIFPIVAKAEEAGSEPARELLAGSAKDLHALVVEVVRQLGLQNTDFLLVKTGGVFEGSAFFSEHFNVLVRQTAPKVRIAPLSRDMAQSTAKLALEILRGVQKLELD